MLLTTILPVVLRLVPVAAPITGVVNTWPVLVQALILPLATVPSAGVTNVGLVNRLVTDNCFVVWSLLARSATHRRQLAKWQRVMLKWQY